jgi:hypothetical protein
MFGIFLLDKHIDPRMWLKIICQAVHIDVGCTYVYIYID